MRGIVGSLAALAFAAGCGGPDLPPGWEDAEELSITQSDCAGSAYESEDESLQASAFSGGIDLVYRGAHFRCEQKVQGFIKRSGEKIEILFQPEDMDPSTVAACDCLYEIVTSVESAPGTFEVSGWRRWDNINDPNDPVLFGKADVTVR